jgi:hypothetical protein
LVTRSDTILGDHRVVTDAQPAEFLLADYPAVIRDTGLTLRALIFRTIPTAVETVRPGWRWIAYSLPESGKVRNFAWIGPERKHIHLGFEHGTLLADPNRILHGAEQRLKKFRYFTFERGIDIDEPILVDFIERAAALAVMPSAARRALTDLGAEALDDATSGVPPDWKLVSEDDQPPRSRETSRHPSSEPRQRSRSAPAPSRRRT